MRKERLSVFIFPEGTRSYADGPEMGAFKKGAFHLAVKAGVPIVPVVAGNYWGVLSVREQRFRGGRIPVKGESVGRLSIYLLLTVFYPYTSGLQTRG